MSKTMHVCRLLQGAQARQNTNVKNAQRLRAQNQNNTLDGRCRFVTAVVSNGLTRLAPAPRKSKVCLTAMLHNIAIEMRNPNNLTRCLLCYGGPTQTLHIKMVWVTVPLLQKKSAKSSDSFLFMCLGPSLKGCNLAEGKLDLSM